MHDTDHLTHLIHPAHGARTIRNTVPATVRLLAIHHAFFLAVAAINREYIALDSAYFLRSCESSRAPGAGYCVKIGRRINQHQIFILLIDILVIVIDLVTPWFSTACSIKVTREV